MLLPSLSFASVSQSTAIKIYNRILTTNRIITNAPRLIFVNDSSVNAYNSGKVIGINTGMLQSVRNESELAWVMGHELGHYYLHHRSSNPSNEYAADKAGVGIARRAGYNMCSGVKLLLRFNKNGSKTHPPAMDRYNRVKC